jgi:hypothetical protein
MKNEMLRFRLKLTNYDLLIKRIHFPAGFGSFRFVLILDLPELIWYPASSILG